MSVDVVAPRTRSDERREAILRIAREVFLQDGYAAASMSGIAAKLGGSKGTLYNYFRSKEELFVAFMREECLAEATATFDFHDYDGDLRAALHRLGVRFLRFVLSETPITVHRLAIAESGRFPELGRALYDAGPKESIDRLTEFLDQVMSEGGIRRCDPRRAAEQFLALSKAGLHQRRLWGVCEHPTEAEIETNVETAVAVFLAGHAVAEGAAKPANLDADARSRA